MKRVMFIAVVAALLSGPALAAINLPGTGSAPVDPFYQLYPVALSTAANPGGAPGPAFARTPHVAWYPPDPGYAWIGPTPGNANFINDPVGFYWYQLNVGALIVGGGNPSGLYHFEGDWATDNGAVLLSDGGVFTQVASLSGPTTYNPLTHFSFDANVNFGEALYFRVENEVAPPGYTGFNPTGLLVENLTATPVVPVPGAVLLAFLGLSVAGMKLRKLV